MAGCCTAFGWELHGSRTAAALHGAGTGKNNGSYCTVLYNCTILHCMFVESMMIRPIVVSEKL